jgi:hypothetical protein
MNLVGPINGWSEAPTSQLLGEAYSASRTLSRQHDGDCESFYLSEINACREHRFATLE